VRVQGTRRRGDEPPGLSECIPRHRQRHQKRTRPIPRPRPAVREPGSAHPARPPTAWENGRRRRTPGWARRALIPLLSSPLSLLSSLGRRPGVSWLVETPKRKPTLPQHTQLPPRTFPEGELFHSPGLPRQRLPGVPALKKFRKPVGLRLNAARHTHFAGSTRCATGERHSTRWPETDRTSRRGSAQEGRATQTSPDTFPRAHPNIAARTNFQIRPRTPRRTAQR
jgi:hypothetical protein